MAIDPAKSEDVAPALAGFLAAHVGVPAVRFAEAPEPVPHGWDTYIYLFRLEPDGGGAALPDAWVQPLVLRLYADSEQWPRAETEAAILRFVSGRGFPAPSPLALAGPDGPLGLPFIIMERLPGRTMVHHVGFNPFRGSRVFASMAALHVRLHQLDCADWPFPEDAPLVERQIAMMRADAERFGLHDLDDGLRWLEQHKHAVMPEERSLCHSDFHPLNIIVGNDERLAVVDWGMAATGDRHFDVANTLALVTLVPTGSLGRFHRVIAGLLRRRAAARYLACYRALLPLDDERLRYWEALVTLRWWLAFACFLAQGSAAVGLKPESTSYVQPEHVASLRAHFDELTG